MWGVCGERSRTLALGREKIRDSISGYLEPKMCGDGTVGSSESWGGERRREEERAGGQRRTEEENGGESTAVGERRRGERRTEEESREERGRVEEIECS